MTVGEAFTQLEHKKPNILPPGSVAVITECGKAFATEPTTHIHIARDGFITGYVVVTENGTVVARERFHSAIKVGRGNILKIPMARPCSQ